MVTAISGIASFRFTARKNPAAPPPTTAVFIDAKIQIIAYNPPRRIAFLRII
jgi:hypothetical protein